MIPPKISKLDVCIYHANCPDGMGAAWAVYKRFGNEVTFLEGHHHKGKDDEDYWLDLCKGKVVGCFDFSFSVELSDKINQVAAQFNIIDHHRSAQESLGGRPYAFFDMEKSGAVLAWEACHDEPAPALLLYIQDRDLWNWQEPHSAEICNYISTYGLDFESYDKLHEVLKSEQGFQSAHLAGGAISSFKGSLYDSIADTYEMWTLGPYTFPAFSASHRLRSGVCAALEDRLMQQAVSYPFVAGWSLEDGKMTFSLRTNHGEVDDVSKVAASLGGGGHAKAAGFTVDVDDVNFKKRTVDVELSK